MSWLVLALLAPVLAAGVFFVWRQPLVALYAFVVGLAVHNAVFMGLWLAGAHGWQLKLLQGWKEILLAAAFLSVVWHRRLPRTLNALDLAAILFALVAVAYFFVPGATLQARFYGLRNLLLPVVAYAAGRGIAIDAREWRRIGVVALATAFAVAALGMVENYALTLSDWRDWDAKGYFTRQLGFPPLHGPAGLPDNWALNLSSGVFRRLISTYLSPLGTSYMLGVALLAVVALLPFVRGRARAALACGGVVVLAAFLLSFSRAAAAGVVGGLILLSLARRTLLGGFAALVVLAASIGVAASFASIAPRTHFFPEDQAWLRQQARTHGVVPNGNPIQTTSSFSDSSSREHLAELRRSFRTFVHHPAGRGLGRSGQIAERFGSGDSAAGESLYLTIAAETGVPGLVALLTFAALALLTLFRSARRGSVPAAVLFAAQAAVFAIGVQTEIWGVPWIVYVLWLLTGATVSRYTSE
jgi:O-antigen ligase/polysaccharide polymerase Wzy-like membrane protein